MGKKSRITKASLVTAFLAAGGAATQAQAAANLDAATAVARISSYYGPLSLEDDFQKFFKITTGETSFLKYYKAGMEQGRAVVWEFADKYDVGVPPGFEED